MKRTLTLLCAVLLLLSACGAQNTANGPQTNTCTLMIECSTALQSDALSDAVRAILPTDGVLLTQREVAFADGESVFDVLKRVCRDEDLALEFLTTPAYQSAYIEGIGNLYEFDCGAGSGWMYSVNGDYPNYGCSRVTLQNGDAVVWRYTCDLGADLGHPGGQSME